jgi:hypothetical protein
MKRLHDAFNPDGLMNPQKVFPTPRGCREGLMSSVRPREPQAEPKPQEVAQ